MDSAGNSSACVVGNFYPGGGGTIGAGMTYAYLAAMHAAGKVGDPAKALAAAAAE